ncbi:hypothetical protein H6G06_25850 [Anabaena sphaerica FACHB-251]|uniref:Uncharacterized protein n=1 Tax=Anabaena sphaerica FACHB-251 TaxID=2692883 RepID=A0A927A4Q5_9NOST|nr:hypothetical protein [Anabaena sphaerica]MBD2296810.1 hypothetical protein [Anabaena sphaerica FACHB-251]
MSLQQYKKNGYLAAGIGSVIGAALLIYPGHFLGIGYVKMFMPNATLDGLFPPFIGFIFGWWFGEVLGCWLTLRLLRYRRAARTAKLLAMMTPVGIFFWMLFYGIAINWIAMVFSQSISLVNLRYITMPLTIAFVAIALALKARYLAQQNTSNF